MPKYKTNLSAKGFRNLAKQVKDYRESLYDKCEEMAYKLAEEGISIAQMKIGNFGAIFTGELMNSISLEPGDMVGVGAKYYIYTGCEWAKFVEFGTGIVGEENPHPDPSLANWKYDVNKHGEGGWYYYRDGEWHWTQGMPSRPFMYETGQELRGKVVGIAQEVFGEDKADD